MMMARIVVALAAGLCAASAARADVIYMPGAGQCLTVAPRNGQIRDWSPIVLAPCTGGPTQQFTWTGKNYQYVDNTRLCIGWHKFRDNEPYPLGLEFCYQDRTFVRPDGNGRVYGASSPEAASRCWVQTPPHANLTSTVGLGPCGNGQFRAGTLQQAMAGKTTTTTTTTTTRPGQGPNQTPDQPNVVFTRVQNVGQWVIQKAYLNNKFDRCRAELGRDDNMLLIVKWASRKWGLAISNTNLAIGSRHKMEVEMDRASEVFNGVVDSTAAWLFSIIPDQTADGLRSVSRIQVKAPFGTRTWNTPGIAAAIGAVEDCFNANSGNAGNAGKPPSPPPPANEVFTRVATIGQWRIVHVYKGGKFDRCRAELGTGAQQINIVKWAANRNWGLSIPARGLLAGSKHPMEIEMGRASNPVTGTVDPKGTNLTGGLSGDALAYMRSTGTLQVSTPTNAGTFNLTGIGAAVGGVEDCFNTNIGNAG